MLMDKAGVNGFIKGVLGQNIEHEINMVQYADDIIFTCPVGSLLMRYLRLPVNEKRIRNKVGSLPKIGWRRNAATGKVDYLPVMVE